jgi:hypothetical protein
MTILILNIIDSGKTPLRLTLILELVDPSGIKKINYLILLLSTKFE